MLLLIAKISACTIPVYIRTNESAAFKNAIDYSATVWNVLTYYRNNFVYAGETDAEYIEKAVVISLGTDIDDDLADTYMPVDFDKKYARIVFNNNVRWCVGTQTNCFDIETVMTHELGHVLGLTHTTHAASIMFPNINKNEKMLPSVEDINKVRSITSLVCTSASM